MATPKIKRATSSAAGAATRRSAPLGCSVTSADGYRAAGIIIKLALAEAQERRPKRCTERMKKTAAYCEGYFAGLVAAACQLALGEYPSFNVETIQRTLSPNEKGEPREERRQ